MVEVPSVMFRDQLCGWSCQAESHHAIADFNCIIYTTSFRGDVKAVVLECTLVSDTHSGSYNPAILSQLSQNLQHAVDSTKEKCVPNTTLHASWCAWVCSHKGAIRDGDMVPIYHVWQPNVYVANSSQCTVDDALSCSHGSSPTLRHNKIRDVTTLLQLLLRCAPV